MDKPQKVTMKNFKIIWLLLFLSCTNKNFENIIPFFNDLEKEVNDCNLFKLFTTAELDVFLLNDDLIHEIFVPKLFETVKKHEFEIKSFLKEQGVVEDSEEEKIFLILLFQCYLNKNNYNEKESLNLAKQIVEKRKLMKFYLKKNDEFQIDEITDLFLNSYKIGDLITLPFPLDYDKKYDEYSVYLNPYPASLNFSNASDTLFLTGILIEMTKKEDQKKSLTIKINVIQNSHPNVFIFDKHYSINDTFNIDIRDYARPPYVN